MKTRILKSVGFGGAISVALFLGCSNQSAQQEQPRTTQVVPSPVPAAAAVAVTNAEVDPTPPILYTAAPPTSVLQPVAPVALGTNAPIAPPIEQRIEQAPPVAGAKLTPAVEEIVKMAQAGVSEEVMLSYVENSPHAFGLNSDGIVYLNDLGVGANVVTAMIRRDAQMGQSAPTVEVAEQPASLTQTQIVSNLPENTVAQPAPAPAPAVQAPPTQVAVAAPAQDPNASYFYDSLAPYGSWMYVGGYGWCWQPTVVVSCAGWAPYCDAGRWYWSDCGWYWHSDYSWGAWAFHYGRWFHHGHAGWIWCPDRVWGPSWVSWRYTSGYCGWAPLPPAACWSAGVGFTFYGGHVGVGFEFGLGYGHYAWVPTHRFCDANPRRHCVAPGQSKSIYYNSTVINNYVVEKNTIINHGVGRETVAKNVGNEMRTVTVRERPATMPGLARPERLHKEGSTLVMERPALPVRTTSASVTPAGRSRSDAVSSVRNSSTPAGASQLTGGRNPALPANRSTVTGRSSSATVGGPAAPDSHGRGNASAPVATTGGNAARNVTSPVSSPASSTKAAPLENKPTTPSAATRVERDASRSSIQMYGNDKRSVPEINASRGASAPAASASSIGSVNPPASTSRSAVTLPGSSSQTRPDVRSSTPSPSQSVPQVRSYTAPTTPGNSSGPASSSSVRSTPSYVAPSSRSSPSSPAPVTRSTPSYSAPSYSAPTTRSAPAYSAPSYSAPATRSTPTYAPPASHAAPSYTPAPMRSAPSSVPSSSPSTPRSSGSGNSGSGSPSRGK